MLVRRLALVLGFLRSFRPPRQILFLLRRQLVDLNPHRLEL
jgi:hypothetical protein